MEKERKEDTIDRFPPNKNSSFEEIIANKKILRNDYSKFFEFQHSFF